MVVAAIPTISSPMNRLSIASSPRNGNLDSPKNKLVLLSSANTTLRQVDYDENVTPLYGAIGISDWDTAATNCNARDASTWVVRYERDAQGNILSPHRIQWRFLPIHSACALNPPASFLKQLLNAYPDGPRTLDDQCLLPLHYACGARCCRETIYSLLMNFPQAALREDPNGMLPLHYLAQWGPSQQQGSLNLGVLDMVLVSTGDKAANCDSDGNTAERLAWNADYDGHTDVAKHIATFLHKKGLGSGTDPASSDSSSIVEVIRSPAYKNKRPVLNIKVASPSNQFDSHTYFDDDHIDEETAIEHAPEGNIEASLIYNVTPLNARENMNHNHTPRYSGQVQKPPLSSPYSAPKSGQRHRSFSWDGEAHQNENFNARDAYSISGSTWTTHLSIPPPPKSASHARQTRQQAGFPPMSPQRGSTSKARGPHQRTAAAAKPTTTATTQQQTEARQDNESGRGFDVTRSPQSFQSGSTNSSKTSYSNQLTQQLLEMAEIERREGMESSVYVSKPSNYAEQKSPSEALLLEEISRLKIEKERALVELAQAKGNRFGIVGSIMGLSGLSPIGEDEMSKLTADDQEEDDEKRVSTEKPKADLPSVLPKQSNEVERLEMEREKIEIQLKKVREEEANKHKEEPAHEEVKDNYRGLFEKEEYEHMKTKDMLEDERKRHNEAIYSHLQEVKSLRESLEKATEEIAKQQSLQSEMKKLQKKEVEWDSTRAKLEDEIKHLKNLSAEQDHSVSSTLTNNSGLDSSVLRMQLENAVKEANDLRNFNAAMRKDHNETISELEDELERERLDKTKSMSKIVTMEYRITTLEEELEKERANKSSDVDKVNSETRIAELEAKLTRESSSKAALKQLVSSLEKDLEYVMAHRHVDGGDIDKMESELHQLKKKLRDKLKEAEKSKEFLDVAKREFKEKEKCLCKQLDDLRSQLNLSRKQHMSETEESYLRKMTDLNSRIRELEEADDNNLVKLREATKVKERIIHEKEDEFLVQMRKLKTEYEKKLKDKDDSYLKEIHDLKKKNDDFREKEESYLRDLRDAEEKMEQAFQDKEALTKQMNVDLVNKMIAEKEEAFREEVAILTDEIEILRQESDIKAKLSECQRELKSRSRKYKSEINKLKHTLSMQKSKEERLEGHIETLEKQIMDMTADYEDRIQEYLYGNLLESNSLGS